MTIIEALNWGNSKLKQNLGEKENNTSPLLDAQLLLAKTLGVTTAFLFTHFDDPIPELKIEKFQKFINRRCHHEPVAYIIGEKDFFKRSFLVSPHVLIPRPATETLIEMALEKVKESNTETWFADIGTGSGAIAVTLAAETRLPVIATDISHEALTTAQKNAEKNQVADLIDFRWGNLLEPLIKIFKVLKDKPKENFCPRLIICANLPYLTDNQWQNLEIGVKNFEPTTALVAGHDGLDLYWCLIRDLKKYRSFFPPALSLILEIDPDQSSKIISLIKHDFPEAEPKIYKDLEGWERIVIVDI